MTVCTSLPFHGILAALGITAQPAGTAIPWPCKATNPTAPGALNITGSAATASTVPAPRTAAPAEEQSHGGVCRGPGEAAHTEPTGSHPAAQAQEHEERA